MNRREAIRNIAIASTATIFLTSCADRNVAEFLVDGHLDLNRNHKKYLAKISETILPLNGISENMQDSVSFIMTMLNDCTSAEDLQDYVTGFEQYKLLMQENKLKIKKADPQETIDLITSTLKSATPQKELIHFITTTKNLSVENLKTSEYYLTKVQDYKMIPDAYQGCVDV